MSFDHALRLARSRGKVGKQLRLAIKIDKYRRAEVKWEALGEKLGRTPESLKKVARHYAAAVEAYHVERLAKAIDIRISEGLRKRLA